MYTTKKMFSTEQTAYLSDKMSIEAILWDYDGTLVDSMPTFISSMLRILDENGITYDKSIVKTRKIQAANAAAGKLRNRGAGQIVDCILYINRAGTRHHNAIDVAKGQR